MLAATATSTERAEPEPFLKWAGGKRWLVPRLAPIIRDYLTETRGVYYEPFLGAGAMAFGASGVRVGWGRSGGTQVLSDVCQPLMATWTAVVSTPQAVSNQLDKMVKGGTSAKRYYEVRAAKPKNPIEAAARFIYLNRTCFNGLYRENKSGVFNVPHGEYASPRIPTREELLAVSHALRGATFEVGDFAQPIEAAGPGDVIFADPPYDGTFADYSKGGFNTEDQERLALALWKAAARRGVFVITTNSDTPFVRARYGKFYIKPVDEKRGVAASGASRGRAPCLLISSRKI